MHNVYYDASMDFFNLNAAPNTFDTTDTPLCTVLVCDVVESVRWMQANEAAAVAQWQTFIEKVKAEVLPQHGARLVKSLGDGLMLEFSNADGLQATPSMALQAAFALQSIALGLQGSAPFQLRIGLHHTPVTVGEDDIYGHGVNLCARIAALAGVGEVVASVAVRDEIVDGLDAHVFDLGDCYFKHIEEPVRVYRLSCIANIAVEAAKPSESIDPVDAVVPTIAVIPFALRQSLDEHLAVGELIADGVIAQLSRSAGLRVISRLSTSRLRTRELDVQQKAHYLKADYLLTGSYVAMCERLMVQAELIKVLGDEVVWSERLPGTIADLFEVESALCQQIAQAAHKAMLDASVQNALIKPLPNLQSYALFLGGVHLIHQASPHSFAKGGAVLEHLVERHPRSAQARTWNATLNMLRVTRGLSADQKRESALALRHTHEALSVEPSNALALATEGIIYCQLKDDPDLGHARLSQAVLLDPSCALGWLYSATVESLRGNTAAAVVCGERAVALSPLDPQAYFYESLYGSALLVDGQSIKAREVLTRSWQKNRYHAPTLRLLIVSQVECNQIDQAKTTMQQLLQIEPSLTAEKYQARSKVNAALRQRFSDALVEAGLPIH